jgi:hypothetical protein
MYPNSTPEFRIVIKLNGSEELQVRYINITQGYKSKWQAIPKIYESEINTTIS